MKQDLEGEEKRMKAKAYLEQARNINIQIDSKLEQVSALRQLAIKASSTLSPVPDARERVVLELRYLAFKDWASIADALGLHIRQVYRLHDEALKHIEIPGECH